MILKLYQLFLVVFTIFTTGCTTYGVIANAPKEVADHEGYSWHSWAKHDRTNELTVIISFSGGGTRAAALALGVLKGLRDTQIPVKGHMKRMLDEIDYISSVSGGSFTAAYYGLYGDEIFETFEEAFLLRNVQKHLFLGLFNPVQWFRTSGRTEMAVNYYNDTVFNGATFSDMNKEGPFIVINATELEHGVRFSFIQEYFSLFCSDLNSFPVAKAVAASSAVPIVFLPVVVEKYPDCGLNKPLWLDEVKKLAEDSPVLYETVKGVDQLLKQDEHRYMHLVDGGITDNLGLRAIIDMVALSGGAKKSLKKLGKNIPKNLVVISVNSSTDLNPEMGLSNREPSTSETLSSVSSIQLSRYNSATEDLMQSSIEKWTDELKKSGYNIKSHFIDISLRGIHKQKQLNIFNKIPTSFALSQETVDQLVTAGQNLLHHDPEFQLFLSDIGGKIERKNQ